MARTYANVPVLSKIKIEGITHYLKDADARGILNSINDGVYAVLQAALGTVADGGDHLVTAGDIKTYVDQMSEAALNIQVLDTLPTANESAYNTYHNSIVLIPDPNAGSSASAINTKVEFIIIKQKGTGASQYKWEEIGRTEIDLSDYLVDVSYVSNTHTLTQTTGGDATTTIHTFGALADADQGEVNLSSYLTGVGVSVTAAGRLQRDDTNGVQIEGAVSAFTTIDSVGTAPSFTEGTFTPNTPTTLNLTQFRGGSKDPDSFVQPTLTTQTKSLYKQGVVASIGTGDDAETLIIENAAKEADIKVVDTFTQGSFTEGTFTPASFRAGFYTPGTAASKAADTWDAGSVPTTKTTTPTFTGRKYAFVGSAVTGSVNSHYGGTETVNPKSSS